MSIIEEIGVSAMRGSTVQQSVVSNFLLLTFRFIKLGDQENAYLALEIMESKLPYMFRCVCVCVCVRAFVRACVYNHVLYYM